MEMVFRLVIVLVVVMTITRAERWITMSVMSTLVMTLMMYLALHV